MSNSEESQLWLSGRICTICMGTLMDVNEHDIVVCDFCKCVSGQGKCHISAHGPCTFIPNQKDMVKEGKYYFCEVHSNWIKENQEFSEYISETINGGYTKTSLLHKEDVRIGPLKNLE